MLLGWGTGLLLGNLVAHRAWLLGSLRSHGMCLLDNGVLMLGHGVRLLEHGVLMLVYRTWLTNDLLIDSLIHRWSYVHRTELPAHLKVWSGRRTRCWGVPLLLLLLRYNKVVGLVTEWWGGIRNCRVLVLIRDWGWEFGVEKSVFGGRRDRWPVWVHSRLLESLLDPILWVKRKWRRGERGQRRQDRFPLHGSSAKLGHVRDRHAARRSTPLLLSLSLLAPHRRNGVPKGQVVS